MTIPGYRCSCRYCDRVLRLASPRLGDDALRMLRDHIRSLHPSASLLADAQAGAILAYYDVERDAE